MSEMGSGIVPAGSAGPGQDLLVADSFRVRRNPRSGAAEVRGWERHAARFTRSALAFLPGAERREADCARRGEALLEEYRARNGDASAAAMVFAEPTAEEAALHARIDAFLGDAQARIAEYGEGFPRLELRAAAEPGGDPEFDLSLRPLPKLHESIELRSAKGIRLEHPGHKGPNLVRLTALNRELGAEALLLDDGARAIEGATTSLVWWTDGTDESGHMVGSAADTPVARVASVTESIIVEAAQRRLVGQKPNRGRTGALTRERPSLSDLMASEVWAVNALHGIRVVTRIDGVALPAPATRRLRWFRDALDRAWEPLLPWTTRGERENGTA